MRRLVSAIHLATQKLATTTSVEETLREVLQICINASGAYGGTLYIHDPIRKTLNFRHVIPESVREKLPASIPEDYGAAGEAFRTQRAIVTSREAIEKKHLTPFEEATQVVVRNMISAPLMLSRQTPIGVVQLINKQDAEFDQNDLEVIEIVCSISAMAYTNSILMEQASRAASLLGMGKVAHDIGNLAGAIQAGLLYLDPLVREFIKKKESTQADEVLGKRIIEEFENVSDAVEQTISYSRLIAALSSGKVLVPDKKLANFSDVIRRAVEFYESKARRLNINLRCELQEDSGPTLFDTQFIHRIVENLVANAINAVFEASQLRLSNNEDSIGEITIRYSRDDRNHIIEVCDRGRGMNKETIQRVLEGTAASNWATRTGTGWGTKIVRELAAGHGGFIEVDSEIGKGTTFRVHIPIERVAEAQIMT